MARNISNFDDVKQPCCSSFNTYKQIKSAVVIWPQWKHVAGTWSGDMLQWQRNKPFFLTKFNFAGNVIHNILLEIQLVWIRASWSMYKMISILYACALLLHTFRYSPQIKQYPLRGHQLGNCPCTVRPKCTQGAARCGWRYDLVVVNADKMRP